MSDVKRTALAALIDDTEERNEWTDARIVQQAAERGCKLTKSDVSYYRTTGMKHMNPVKVEALAQGLRLPAYRVAFAVLADLGIDVPMDVRTPEDAIHHDHTLTARTREILLAVLAQERR